MGSWLIPRIFWIVDLIAAPMSNPWARAYSSEASTLRVTRLHFIEDQWIMFAVRFWSVSTITYLICKDRSLLLAKEASIKIIKLSKLILNSTNVRPLVRLSICY